MLLTAAAVLALAARCAPQVAPETLLAVARVESGLDPLAVGVNRVAAHASPLSVGGPVHGATLDLGLAQINSANLSRLGLTPATAFDPCRNLAAAARLLAADYRAARARSADPQAAVRTALSLYNTGHPLRGFRNGYVARVEAAAHVRSPSPAGPPRGRAVFPTQPHADFVITPDPPPEGAQP